MRAHNREGESLHLRGQSVTRALKLAWVTALRGVPVVRLGPDGSGSGDASASGLAFFGKPMTLGAILPARSSVAPGEVRAGGQVAKAWPSNERAGRDRRRPREVRSCQLSSVWRLREVTSYRMMAAGPVARPATGGNVTRAMPERRETNHREVTNESTRGAGAIREAIAPGVEQCAIR